MFIFPYMIRQRCLSAGDISSAKTLLVHKNIKQNDEHCKTQKQLSNLVGNWHLGEKDSISNKEIFIFNIKLKNFIPLPTVL